VSAYEEAEVDDTNIWEETLLKKRQFSIAVTEKKNSEEGTTGGFAKGDFNGHITLGHS
jgi:hypothetical protein